MRYDELQHTQLLRWYMCGMHGIKIGARPFLKRMFGKRRRIWNKKLTEVEMNTLRESYRSPDSPCDMERVRDSGSPSRL